MASTRILTAKVNPESGASAVYSVGVKFNTAFILSTTDIAKTERGFSVVRVTIKDTATGKTLTSVVLVGNETETAVLQPIPTSVTFEVECLLGASRIDIDDSHEDSDLAPSSDEKAALAGSAGSPSASNRYVTHANGKVVRLSSDFQLVTVAGAATTIDLSLGYNIDVDLQDDTTFTLTNPRDGERYIFVVTQAGGFDITWPVGLVLWSPSLEPVTVDVGAIDVFTLVWRSTLAKYLGSFTQNFA